MPPVAMILGLLSYAPSAIKEITDLYNAIKGTFSAKDQQTVDDALQAARNADWASTAAADDALDAAAKRT